MLKSRLFSGDMKGGPFFLGEKAVSRREGSKKKRVVKRLFFFGQLEGIKGGRS